MKRGVETLGTAVREGTAALLSLMIAIVTVIFLWHSYWIAGAEMMTVSGLVDQSKLAAFARQKDLLLLATGMLGTILGYYFGRVPAEKQADIARKRAEEISDASERLKSDIRTEVNSIAATRGGLGGRSADPTDAAITRMIHLVS
jgi:hypothetical protein